MDFFGNYAISEVFAVAEASKVRSVSGVPFSIGRLHRLCALLFVCSVHRSNALADDLLSLFSICTMLTPFAVLGGVEVC